MVPLDSTEPPRSEISKAIWFTEGVSLVRLFPLISDIKLTVASAI